MCKKIETGIVAAVRAVYNKNFKAERRFLFAVQRQTAHGLQNFVV